jgi:integration host factor subunit beta
MTKADIAQNIARATGLTQTDTAAVIDGFIEAVSAALEQGERVEIRGFGTFRVVQRAARTGRNPRAGTHVEIPPRSAPTFKPSREIRARVNRKGHSEG